MSHTYATVAQLEDYLRDQGSQDLGQQNDALLLGRLEAASRRIDEHTSRSSGYRTGFGPRIGTNHYDGTGGSCLRLKDDLVSATTVTVRSSTGASSPKTPLIDVDWFGYPEEGPYRELQLHGQGTVTVFGYGLRVTDVLGVWSGPGYGTLSTLATIASGLAADATATTCVLSASPDFSLSPGQMLLVGTEQIYLTALSGTNASLKRGQNGTTAAVHADASAITVYTYHPDVVDGTLQLAQRRLRGRDAGLSGNFEGDRIPTTAELSSERSLLRAAVGDLRLPEVR